MPPPTGSGDVLTVDAAELKALAKSASTAKTELENIARQAASIIGSLDGRGWNLGGVQARWSGANGKFSQLELTLEATTIDLAARAVLVELFEKGPGFGAPAGGQIPGYKGMSLKDFADVLFPSHGFQEKKFETDFKLLLNGKPTGKKLAQLKGELPEFLLPTAASIAERARQVALRTAPAGTGGRRINALDKLAPTASYNVDLYSLDKSLLSFAAGGKNANVSLEVLAAHVHAAAGLSADLRRGRLSGSVDFGAEANLIDVHAHAAVNVGNSMLGAGAEADGQAAVGANAEARAGLTMDAMKGKVTGDVGLDAFAGASAEADGSVSGTVAGAKTAVTGSASAYAGVGIGLKADGNLDLMHGKVGFKLDVGAALGVGAKFDLGMNVDLSGVPHAIGDAASSVVHTVSHLIPHVHIGPISFP